ncbi:hypothetical protein EVAR_53995_1 [Eumeta japonica]|uniref:Uncharacterized protein n=1 Tax=Eumeta variegata TaxID=151549 RepID=A0A4C1YSP1_EUMVA|nr:hypothetical protein EVAR_53995_1 [Eumeta japonica]
MIIHHGVVIVVLTRSSAVLHPHRCIARLKGANNLKQQRCGQPRFGSGAIKTCHATITVTIDVFCTTQHRETVVTQRKSFANGQQ